MTNDPMPYSILGHKATAEEYIAFQASQIGGLEEELAKAMEVVRMGGDRNNGDGTHFCIACGGEWPASLSSHHKPNCPVIWLRRHGLR